MIEELMRRARRAQRSAAQPDLAQANLIAQRMPPGDAPSLRADPRAATDDAALSAMNEEVIYARAFKLFDAAIERVTLPNAAKVELHPLPRESDRARFGIKRDMLAADALQDRRDVFFGRY